MKLNDELEVNFNHIAPHTNVNFIDSSTFKAIIQFLDDHDLPSFFIDKRTNQEKLRIRSRI